MESNNQEETAAAEQGQETAASVENEQAAIVVTANTPVQDADVAQGDTLKSSDDVDDPDDNSDLAELIEVGTDFLSDLAEAALRAPANIFLDTAIDMEEKHGDGNGAVKKAEAVNRIVGAITSLHPVIEKWDTELRTLWVGPRVERAVSFMNGQMQRRRTELASN